MRESLEREAELIEQAKAGSAEAFADLLRIHQAHVHAYLGGFLRNWVSVEDLAQETFVAAYESLNSYRSHAPFRHWLFGIARNQALMHLRREQKRRSHEVQSLESSVIGWLAGRVESKPGEPGQQEQRMSALRSCLEELPPASSGLVRDYYLKQRSTGKIAQSAGKKEGAILKTLYRVRQALRDCIRMRLGAMGAKP